MDDLKFGPPIRDVPPSPGGIPPWDPPDDLGDIFAHEGWVEWVQEHGNLRERLQLFSYQIEQVQAVFVREFTPALQSVTGAINRFMKSFSS